MNDKLKGIIVCGVVVVCLGGTLGILKLTGVDKTDTADSSADSDTSKASTSSEEDESVALVTDKTTDDIAKITATNEYGGFTYIGAADSGKTTAYIEELKGLTLSSSTLSDVAEDAANLTAYKLAEENASDLAKYGLDEPTAEFTITYGDDTAQTFCIGDVCPQNRYRYVCEKDSADVYMVLNTTISYYTDRKESFIDTTLLASASSDDDIDFGKLTLSRKDLDYDMVFENDDGQFEKSNESMPSAQVMTEPIFSYLNGTSSSETLYSLFGLTAEEVTVSFPTEDDMKEYGLDDPDVTVTFTGDDYDYKLTIGNEYHEVNDEGEEQTDASAYYCYFTGVDGKDCIWKVDASALPWVDLQPGDIITTLMTWNNIIDVSEVEVSGDENVFFKLTSEAEESSTSDTDSTDSEADEEVTAVTMDGEDCDVECFKGLYEYILTCPTSEICFEDPEGEPYLTLDIRREDGGGDTIEFYKDTDRRSVVKLNGRTSYRIQSKWVDRFVKNIELVRNGEEVVEDY